VEQNRVGRLSATSIWVIVGGTVVIFFGVIIWAFFLANMKLWHRRWTSNALVFSDMKIS
jgi:hypothetical protein